MEMEPIPASTYQTQEEFDNKFGAKYESYGLHIKKVSILIHSLPTENKFSCYIVTLSINLISDYIYNSNWNNQP